MQNGFAITFEDMTPESAEQGDAEARGFEYEDTDIKTATSYLRNMGALGCHCEADSSPISAERPPRWFTFYNVEEDYRTGRVRSMSLHLPRNVTGSTAMRIARLVGCYGVAK